MSKYLVTGGAGFIGTNLVKQLLLEGNDVRVIDNYSSGKKEERFQKEAEYMEGDIRDKNDLKKAMSGISGVFHLAAVPRMPYSVEHPRETNDNNANGTLNVLSEAKEAGVERVVYSSSSSVVGNISGNEATNEEIRPRPISPYGLQKWIGEEYCRLFSELYGIKTVALRYFNVYGPFMDPEGSYALVIGKFLRQKMNGEPMTICGDGEYYRDYTHVSDIVRANILAMRSDKVGGGEIINIGNGSPKSVNELVKIIGGPTINIDPRLGDPRYTKADNSKAKKLLGWEPTISLEDGIKELKKEWLVI